MKKDKIAQILNGEGKVGAESIGSENLPGVSLQLPNLLDPNASFVAKRLDRIKSGGLACWYKTEYHSNCG